MANMEQMHDLMIEIGPLMELAEVVEFDNGAAWSLAIDDDVAVLAEYDPEQGRLHLTGEVGAPPAERRTATYETLLLFNGHWQETGGVRMALDEPGGLVLQVVDITADGLNAAALQMIVGNFVEKLLVWRTVIDAGVGSGEADAAGAEAAIEREGKVGKGAIRV